MLNLTLRSVHERISGTRSSEVKAELDLVAATVIVLLKGRKREYCEDCIYFTIRVDMAEGQKVNALGS